ncbi:hypothetical protein ACE6H2_015125 [Prunus campanulata]
MQLDLSSNNFGGQIPWSLLNLESLVYLNLGGNNYVGQFPEVDSNSKGIASLYDFSKQQLNQELATKKPSTKAWRVAAIHDVPVVADPTPVAITWQIVVGAIAGVTPFVVAGIEFGKRIIAQKRCEVCGGSGLVLTKEDYVKCPGCGMCSDPLLSRG